MRIRPSILLCLGLLIFATPVDAQDTEGPLQDAFLDGLAGAWSMNGHVMGDSVTYDANGTWVLNHQFLRFRMEDVHSPPEYVARVFVGYDPKEEEYVAHWLDSSGGRPSKTLGYGERENGALTFTFEYPDGPFRTTFEATSDTTWHIHMRSKADGKWSTFAEYDVVPRPHP